MNKAIRIIYFNGKLYKTYTPNGFLGRESNIGLSYYISKPLKLPKGMSYEEAYKVISFLKDKTVKEGYDNEAKRYLSISKALKKWGFEKQQGFNSGYYQETLPAQSHKKHVPTCEYCEIEGVKDLVVLSGDEKVVTKTDIYENYFDWYVPKVSENMVKEIYAEKHLTYPNPSNEQGK